jgi:hypothetical protein
LLNDGRARPPWEGSFGAESLLSRACCGCCRKASRCSRSWQDIQGYYLGVDEGAHAPLWARSRRSTMRCTVHNSHLRSIHLRLSGAIAPCLLHLPPAPSSCRCQFKDAGAVWGKSTASRQRQRTQGRGAPLAEAQKLGGTCGAQVQRQEGTPSVHRGGEMPNYHRRI